MILYMNSNTNTTKNLINELFSESSSEIEQRLLNQMNSRIIELVRTSVMMIELNKIIIDRSQDSIINLNNGRMVQGSVYGNTAEKFSELETEARQISKRITDILESLNISDQIQTEIWNFISQEIITATR